LQEIAEGTIVQWTFSYEVGGMLSGLRNTSRQIENTMASSLKTLYRQVKAYATEGGFDAKSLMREAPDVEARAQYKPRHPTAAAKSAADTETAFRPPEVSAVFDEPPVTEDDGQALQVFDIDEPPVTVDDTRPRPAAANLESSVRASDIPPDMDGEPEFLADMSVFEPPRRVHDTQPHPSADVFAQNESGEADDEAFKQPLASISQVALETPQAEVIEPDDLRRIDSAPGSDIASAPSASEIEQPSSSPTTEVHLGASIWDVFGVQRPTETGALNAAPEVEREPVVMSSASLASPSRQGLRIRLRRNLVHLRRPL
jgi:hypothetical protein